MNLKIVGEGCCGLLLWDVLELTLTGWTYADECGIVWLVLEWISSTHCLVDLVRFLHLKFWIWLTTTWMRAVCQETSSVSVCCHWYWQFTWVLASSRCNVYDLCCVCLCVFLFVTLLHTLSVIIIGSELNEADAVYGTSWHIVGFSSWCRTTCVT